MIPREVVLSQVISWCRSGFASYDASYYDRIDEALATLDQTDDVTRMRRLAKAGPDMISQRFAYPHIESAANAALSTPDTTK